MTDVALESAITEREAMLEELLAEAELQNEHKSARIAELEEIIANIQICARQAQATSHRVHDS